MAFGKKTDRAGLQAVLELKNVDYSKDPVILSYPLHSFFCVIDNFS